MDLKSKVLRLEQEVREAQAGLWAAQDSAKHGREEGERLRGAASVLEADLSQVKDSLSRARIREEDAERRASEAEVRLKVTSPPRRHRFLAFALWG